NAETFLEWREEPKVVEDLMRFLDNVLEDFIRRAPPAMAAAATMAKVAVKGMKRNRPLNFLM
ncbi:hypothetical protein CVH10_23215, partial [Halomonas sp. ND22Bw]